MAKITKCDGMSLLKFVIVTLCVYVHMYPSCYHTWERLFDFSPLLVRRSKLPGVNGLWRRPGREKLQLQEFRAASGQEPAKQTNKQKNLSLKTIRGWILPTTWGSLKVDIFPFVPLMRLQPGWHLDGSLVRTRAEGLNHAWLRLLIKQIKANKWNCEKSRTCLSVGLELPLTEIHLVNIVKKILKICFKKDFVPSDLASYTTKGIWGKTIDKDKGRDK